MCPLAKFIFLAGIINSSLYVSKPRCAHHCVITIDYDDKKNDTYPEQWAVMDMYGNFCRLSLEEKLLKQSINIKIRYVFKDGSYFLPTEEWTTLVHPTKRKDKLHSWIFYGAVVSLIWISIASLCVSAKILKKAKEHFVSIN